MRLVSCYISSFGRIKDYEYRFHEGLNTILQDNGWGKSTFSAFIKAMLYGMEYSPRTKKELLDRNHYLPWDGSKCGGVLTIEVEGREYRINRSFGKTDKDDTFELIDCRTGLVSSDYSANIGEELFQVDRESFEKTIYLPQGCLDTGMTDSINAKMGGLAAAKDDISNFDGALKRVNAARTEYTRNSKINPGKLTSHKQKLSETKHRLERLPVITERYDGLLDILRSHNGEYNLLLAQKEAVGKRIEEQSKREQLIGTLKTIHDNLETESAELEAAGRELKKADIYGFSRHMPSEEDFASFNEQITDISQLRAKVESAKIQQEDSVRLEELKNFFARRFPTSEELSAAEKLAVEIGQIDIKKEQAKENLLMLEAERKASDSIKTQSMPVGKMLGIVLLIGFIVSGIIFLMGDFGLYIAATFFAFAMMDLIILVVTSGKQKSDYNQRMLNYDTTIEQAKDVLEELQHDYKEKQLVCDDFLSDYLVKRNASLLENIYDIRLKLEQYERLIGQEQLLSEAVKSTIDELTEKQIRLATILQPYNNAYEVDIYETGSEFDFIIRLKKDVDTYRHALNRRDDCAARVEALKQQIADFEKNNDINSKTDSVADLQDTLRELDEAITDKHKLILKDQDDIRDTEVELEELTELAEGLEAMEAEGVELRYQLRIIESTLDLLQLARDNFLSKYIKPLKDSLHGYLGLIESDTQANYEIEAYDIDLDLNVRLDYQGSLMGVEYLSEGYKDMIGLCSRMAMIDVLYNNETPVIIMDDPFVNLDEDKLASAMVLLKEISAQKQIVYFTCHKARM